VYHDAILTFFYSLPGADKIAIKTGAIVVGNGEAINVLRTAGVPESQLVPVSGGERVPLFTNRLRQAAAHGEIECAPGPPGAPPVPDTGLAVASVHVWPSLHCLMPGASHAEVPEVMDTGKVGSQHILTWFGIAKPLTDPLLSGLTGVHWRC